MKRTNLEILNTLKENINKLDINVLKFVEKVSLPQNNYKVGFKNSEYIDSVVDGLSVTVEHISALRYEEVELEVNFAHNSRNDSRIYIAHNALNFPDVASFTFAQAYDIAVDLMVLIDRGVSKFNIINSPAWGRKSRDMFIKLLIITGMIDATLKGYKKCGEFDIEDITVLADRDTYTEYYSEFEMTNGLNVFMGMGSKRRFQKDNRVINKVADFVDNEFHLHVVDFSAKGKVFNGVTHVHQKAFMTYKINVYSGEDRDNTIIFDSIVDGNRTKDLISLYNEVYDMMGKGQSVFIIQAECNTVKYSALLAPCYEKDRPYQCAMSINNDADPSKAGNLMFAQHIENVLHEYLAKTSDFIDGEENSEIEMILIDKKGREVTGRNNGNGRKFKEQTIIVKGHVRKYKSGKHTMVYPHLRQYGVESLEGLNKKIKMKI